jgi:hypothetical protein
MASLLVLGVLYCSECDAAWIHSPSDGYEVYYWNSVTNPKFRYEGATGQWGHYSTIGSTWYALSAAGMAATFIGDGGWYNLKNGLFYSYNSSTSNGFFSRYATYRFFYNYGVGQWYTSGCGGGWHKLGGCRITLYILRRVRYERAA